ncbi:MAG: hypothetical protein Kow0065_13520 [Methylomicrobium sp.]
MPAAKAIAEQSAQTVTKLIDEWFRKKIDGKLASAHARRLSFDKYVIPTIGKLKIEAVKPRHIGDFRATMRTHLTSRAIGVDIFVTERCLNHKIPGMAGVYDRGDYFIERRAALEKWTAFLQTAEEGK